MQLVLGLGNPGPRYALTRHNIGSRCIEALAIRLGLVFAEAQPQYRAAVGEGPAGPVTLLQPQTFMNCSGKALISWSIDAGYPVGVAPGHEPAAMPAVVPVVVCDDLNLGLGSLRIRGRGGDGGQKGLASVIGAIGSEEVPRMRLGIGPLGETVAPEDWSSYVLQKFRAPELEIVDELVERGAEALCSLLVHGWEIAASRFNRRVEMVDEIG